MGIDTALCRERFLGAYARHGGGIVVPAESAEPPRTDAKSEAHVRTPSFGPLHSADYEALATTVRQQICEHEGALKLHSMVAMVPDPIESGLGYQFYSALHGLQLALEAPVPPVESNEVGEAPKGAPLRRDQSWLPWDDRRLAEPLRKGSEDCRISTPGVMLFRGDKQELLSVFIVGETPVTGPHHAALHNALSAAKILRGACDAEDQAPDAPLRVLGPAFSGGAAGLARALRHHKATVRSGTASASQLPATFAELDGVDFARTTPPEPELMCALYDYLRDARSPLADPTNLGQNVAVLSESNTEFGIQARSPGNLPCAFEPALRIGFPLGIAAVRSEWERSEGEREAQSPTIARRTSLELDMDDDHRALVFESAPPARVTQGRDIALGRALVALASMPVQYVAIHATDIADAMFLARKLRDAVPDVRIVFLEASAILMHPTQLGSLLGSLVISPYPMLGTSSFGSQRDQERYALEGESVLGVANAVSSLQGRSPESFIEYNLAPGLGKLPIWVSALGRDGLVPLRASARQLHDGNVVGDGSPPRDELAQSALEPPRSWQFLFLCFALFTFVDWTRQAREQMYFELHDGCGGMRPTADPRMPSHDHDWDLAALRVKALGQQVARSWILTGVLVYMGVVSWLAREFITQDPFGDTKLMCAFGATTLAFVAALLRTLQLARESRAFAQHPQRNSLPLTPSPVVRGVMWSLHGTLVLGSFCFVLLSFAAFLHLSDNNPGLALRVEQWERGEARVHAEEVRPALQHDRARLFVLRTMDLSTGVTPFVPIALAACCMYLYALGRCARLGTAYALASISPDDGVADGVSTPLTALIYPHDAGERTDLERGYRREGMLADEAHLVNSVAHPNCQGRWLIASLTALLPLLFILCLKRPSALGTRHETFMLFSVLVLCCALTLLVLLYLFEYWRSLERLLKRLLEHPIGFSFRHVHVFARDALPDMVAREPDETLRLAACAQLAANLLTAAPERLRSLTPNLFRYSQGELQHVRSRALRRPSNAWSGWWGLDRLVRSDLRRVRELLPDQSSSDEPPQGAPPHAPAAVSRDSLEALSTSGVHPLGADGRPELNPRTTANLGFAVLSFACAAMAVLERAWNPQGLPLPRPSGEPAAITARTRRGAWTATAGAYTEEDARWMRDLERFVATVSALVLGRYVRQYKHFVYVSTGCSLLLLCAISSYAFEPQRVLLTCVWLLMALTVSLTVFVYVGLDRNTLLSHISGSRPDKVTLSGTVLLRGALWVGVPLLSVLAAQYPNLANGLYELLAPALRALR